MSSLGGGPTAEEALTADAHVVSRVMAAANSANQKIVAIRVAPIHKGRYPSVALRSSIADAIVIQRSTTTKITDVLSISAAAEYQIGDGRC